MDPYGIYNQLDMIFVFGLSSGHHMKKKHGFANDNSQQDSSMLFKRQMPSIGSGISLPCLMTGEYDNHGQSARCP